MFRRRFIPRLLITVTIMTFMLGALSSTAQGALSTSCGYKDSIFNGEVDFGSGNHSGGSPAADGTVTWTFTSVNGVIVGTARVRGTLYLDKVGPGQKCARLRINFQDINGNNLEATQDVAFCGPGNDANSSANQRAIDVTNVFPSAQLRQVQLTLGEGQTLGTIDDLHTGIASTSTDVHFGDKINNGNADFGFRPHSGGSPQSDGSIDLSLRGDGIVFGRVNGILFWDALFGDGTVRAITDFKDRNGNTLATRTSTLDGKGCCATDSKNQSLIDHRFNSADLFKIRLRVGQVSNGSFVNVASRNYSFGCVNTVGTVEGVPVDTTTRVGDDVTYGVRWTVPDPKNWHSLKTLDVRLIDEEGAILQLRWDEATNTFSQINTANGQTRKSGLPGSHVRFNSPEVNLFLKDSEVIGSGPTGPSVLLNLALRFKKQATGRTFTVEARATDDSGIEQGWDAAGEITVLPRHGGGSGDDD